MATSFSHAWHQRARNRCTEMNRRRLKTAHSRHARRMWNTVLKEILRETEDFYDNLVVNTPLLDDYDVI
jgi:hypothetical protein